MATRLLPESVCNVVHAFHNVINFQNGSREERFLVISELCTGDLFDFILNSPGHCISEQQTQPVFLSICESVQKLHLKGLIHRDIKPDNVLQDKNGKWKIADFGWAKLIPDGAAAVMHTSNLGTARHNAPEVSTGIYSMSVDVFSLGTTLYFMLSGQLPYLDWEVENKAHNKGMEFLETKMWEKASPEVTVLLAQMLEGDASKRITVTR